MLDAYEQDREDRAVREQDYLGPDDRESTPDELVDALLLEFVAGLKRMGKAMMEVGRG